MSPQTPDREPQPGSRADILRRAGPYLGIGSTFLAAIAVCLFGGWWLDRLLGTTPWLTVAGAMLGIAAGFYLFLKIVLGGAGAGSDGEP